MFFLCFQDNGKRYRVGEIYIDNNECPPISYKCRRPAPRRNLVWEQMENGNSFQGIMTFSGHILESIRFRSICRMSSCWEKL